MEEGIKSISSKISSYNVFTNLFPGIVFAYLLLYLFDVQIVAGTWIADFFIYYFWGIVLNRIGSIVIEPIMKKIKIKKKLLLQFAPYSDYIKASSNDSIISTLSEINNTYRALLSCSFCTLVLKAFFEINNWLIGKNFLFFESNKDWIGIILLLTLFALSYIKQTAYVRERIEEAIKSTGEEKTEKVTTL